MSRRNVNRDNSLRSEPRDQHRLLGQPRRHRTGPLLSGFRPHTVPIECDLQSDIREQISNDIREEVSNQLEEFKINLLDEISTNQTESQAAFIQDIRKSLREDLAAHRRAAREELHTSSRFSTANPEQPPTMTDNPHISNASITAANHSDNLPHIINSANCSTITLNQIKPDTYDGTKPFIHYERHFEIAATHNKWSNEDKAAHLATCLRDKAQLVLEKLSKQDLHNYQKITEILNERFNDKHLSRMYFNELQARKQEKHEDYKTFADEIEKLVRLAYLDTPEETRDRVACLQFINGIDNAKIEFTLRSEQIESLQKAVARATELKSIHYLLNAKRKFSNTSTNRSEPNTRYFYSPKDKPYESMHSRANVQCFKCQIFGHYANECVSQNSHSSSYKNSNLRHNPNPHHNSYTNQTQNHNSNFVPNPSSKNYKNPNQNNSSTTTSKNSEN